MMLLSGLLLGSRRRGARAGPALGSVMQERLDGPEHVLGLDQVEPQESERHQQLRWRRGRIGEPFGALGAEPGRREEILQLDQIIGQAFVVGTVLLEYGAGQTHVRE